MPNDDETSPKVKVIVSVATSMDGYMDDLRGERMVFSSPRDWTEVYKLRGSVDAILVGAGTLRADNPGLRAKGYGRDPLRVTLSRSGDLDRSLKFFADANHAVFPSIEALIEGLEERGVGTLLVEGGAQVLEQFFAAGLVDELRWAMAPLFLGEAAAGAPRFCGSGALILHASEQLGDTSVLHFLSSDRHFLQAAIDLSRQCTPSPTAYSVGAVVVTKDGQTFGGYTHETGAANHAEEEAVAKALAASVPLDGATIYSSMEPCSERRSKPVSCSQLIIDHHFSRMVYALKEPPHFVKCTGAALLESVGIAVREIADLSQQVIEINQHILKP